MDGAAGAGRGTGGPEARLPGRWAEGPARAGARAGGEARVKAEAEREPPAGAEAGLAVGAPANRAARKDGEDEVAGAERRLAPPRAAEAGTKDPAWRDWAGGLPEKVLEQVARTLVAETEAAWAAWFLKEVDTDSWTEARIQQVMEMRERGGNCLFVFARVCREWRKAQLKVGGPLRTRVCSDVIPPGRVALAKWALAEGCPREKYRGFSMANVAAGHGHWELVRWLCGEEGGFAMDGWVMRNAAGSGNLELVRWLRGAGCPWDHNTCYWAVEKGRVETLRWAREHGCPWTPWDRDRAAAELGYADDFGQLV